MRHDNLRSDSNPNSEENLDSLTPVLPMGDDQNAVLNIIKENLFKRYNIRTDNSEKPKEKK